MFCIVFFFACKKSDPTPNENNPSSDIKHYNYSLSIYKNMSVNGVKDTTFDYNNDNDSDFHFLLVRRQYTTQPALGGLATQLEDFIVPVNNVEIYTASMIYVANFGISISDSTYYSYDFKVNDTLSADSKYFTPKQWVNRKTVLLAFNQDVYLGFNGSTYHGGNTNIYPVDGRYIGFRVRNGSGYNYGWLQLKVSSDYTTITIADAAIEMVKDKSIAIGKY
jgi:hypothetical protein